jgi:hypothetical protein
MATNPTTNPTTNKMATRDRTEYERQVAAIIEQTLSEMSKTDLTLTEIINKAREKAER